MKILVPVKRVPDPETRIKIQPGGSGIETQGVKFVVNPFDEIAVEEALRIQEKHKAEVVVISIGGPEVVEQIRTALAMGADRGIHVNCTLPLDPYAVAKILASVARSEGFDLILMGKQAIDDDANQTGQILSAFLDIPQATFANKVEVDPGSASILVGREVDGGIEEKRIPLPALITADLRLNQPRYASLPGIMKAKKKEVKTMTLEEFGIKEEVSQLKVVTERLEAPPARKGAKKVESVDELIHLLRTEARVF
jgi:electron transfer flavoprotein beta subunit